MFVAPSTAGAAGMCVQEPSLSDFELRVAAATKLRLAAGSARIAHR